MVRIGEKDAGSAKGTTLAAVPEGVGLGTAADGKSLPVVLGVGIGTGVDDDVGACVGEGAGTTAAAVGAGVAASMGAVVANGAKVARLGVGSDVGEG